MIANIDNDNGDSLIHSVLCRTLTHRCDRNSRHPNRRLRLGNSVHVLHTIRFISRGPVNGSAHSGPIACLGTCSRVHGLFTRRPLTGRVNCATNFFSFGDRKNHYRRYGNRNAVAIRVRFVTSLILRYRTYRNGHFGTSALLIACRSGGVRSVLRVAIGRTMRFFARRKTGGMIHHLGPLRSMKLNCIGLKRDSSALSNNRGRHIGLTCCLDLRGSSPAVFVFSRPAANLRFRSVGGLLYSFSTLVRHNRAVIVVRRGVRIVGYTSRVVSVNPRKNSHKNRLMTYNAPRRITRYRTSCANEFLGRGVGL